VTLIVAVPAQDGLVLGSDSQLTAGAIRSTGNKVFKLNESAIWAASGELALIQRVKERIEGYPQRDQPLAATRDVLAGFVKDSVQALLNLDFRTQFFVQNPQALLQLHPGDFLFAEHREGKTRVLHILANGTPEWVDGHHAASGGGEHFAQALMCKYNGIVLPCDRAKLLVYKVIEEAIQVGAYGLGPPIDVWHIDKDGVKQAGEAELAGLEDAVKGLREREVEVLAAELGPPAAEEPEPAAGEPAAGEGDLPPAAAG